jgi:hypothetical protein
MTVNDCRLLVEVQSDQHFQNGNISQAERESIHHISGHSSDTAKEYYMRHSFANFVQGGKAVFDAIESSTPSNTVFDNPPPQIQWGTLHPEYASTGKRVKWTSREIQFVGKYCTENSSMKNVYSNCLKQLRSDECMQPYFHMNHVNCSDRLKYGHIAYIKLQKQKI